MKSSEKIKLDYKESQALLYVLIGGCVILFLLHLLDIGNSDKMTAGFFIIWGCYLLKHKFNSIERKQLVLEDRIDDIRTNLSERHEKLFEEITSREKKIDNIDFN